MKNKKTTSETGGNLPSNPLRWTVRAAAREFGFQDRTIQSRLVEFGVAAGEDNCYSTGEILRIIAGPLGVGKERVRLTAAKAALAERELANLRNGLVPVTQATAVLEEWAKVILQTIENSSLGAKEREVIITELRVGRS